MTRGQSVKKRKQAWIKGNKGSSMLFIYIDTIAEGKKEVETVSHQTITPPPPPPTKLSEM